MINLAQEESYKLSAKDRYDILNFAIKAADDDGFVSSFIFERAMYLYAATILDEDKADIIWEKIFQNLIEAWDYAIQEKIIQEMLENYKDDLDQLAEEGWSWFEEYNNYILSARGVLNFAEQFSGDLIGSAAKTFKDTVEETGAKDIINLADEWGMNRTVLKTEETKEIKEENSETLF